jgi:5-methylcytosine-specific restriction endonuclease McrA
MKRKILRLSLPELQHQRERVRRRDGYRCTQCGGLGPLQVHHKKRRSDGGGDEMENLVSLCLPCHKAAHPERLVRWRRPA